MQKGASTAFNLMELPYALSDLKPYMSQKTLEFHYQKHHAGYVTNLNKLIGDVDDDLESVCYRCGLVFGSDRDRSD